MRKIIMSSLLLSLAAAAQPPKDWMNLPWEEKSKVLRGFYAPKGQDLEEMKAAVSQVDKGAYEKKFKVLLMYRCGGYAHPSIESGNQAVQLLGDATGAFCVNVTDKYEDLSYENLSQYDVVLFNNTTRLGLSKYPKAQEGILKFLADGKGYAGLHAASDTYYDWPEGQKIVGGIFAGHPWNAGFTWAFKLETPEHPILKGFNKEGFWMKDEIYMYRPGSFSRERSRVLVSLDFENERNGRDYTKDQAENVLGTDLKNYDIPVSWIHAYDKGRVFYTNFGHNPSTFRQTNILQHIYDGLQYAAGNLQADDMASANLEKVMIAPTPHKDGVR